MFGESECEFLVFDGAEKKRYCYVINTSYQKLPFGSGTIVMRTCDQHKNLYIPLLLLTIFGPDYPFRIDDGYNDILLS